MQGGPGPPGSPGAAGRRGASGPKVCGVEENLNLLRENIRRWNIVVSVFRVNLEIPVSRVSQDLRDHEDCRSELLVPTHDTNVANANANAPGFQGEDGKDGYGSPGPAGIKVNLLRSDLPLT